MTTENEIKEVSEISETAKEFITRAKADTEQVKAAYAKMGIPMPEKTIRIASMSNKKYKTSSRDLSFLEKDTKVEDTGEAVTEIIPAEDKARTFRAYIAYKIGHIAKEVNMDNGKTCFLFQTRNRRVPVEYILEIDTKEEGAWDKVVEHYEKAMAVICEKFQFFHKDDYKVMLVVTSRNMHVVRVAEQGK